MWHEHKTSHNKCLRKNRRAGCFSQDFGRFSANGKPVGTWKKTNSHRKMPRHRKSHWWRGSVRRAATGYRLGIPTQLTKFGGSMIPASYKNCVLRCTLPPSHDGSIGIAFNHGDEIIRVQISREDACILAKAIVNPIYRVTIHDEISSGIPSSDVSPAAQDAV